MAFHDFMAWLRKAGQAWRGAARHGRARRGLAGQARRGLARQGVARRGLAGMAWLGRRGKAGKAWRGQAWHGEVRLRKAGQAWHGPAGRGVAGQGIAGEARHGRAWRGGAWRGQAGLGRRGEARPGRAWHGRAGMTFTTKSSAWCAGRSCDGRIRLVHLMKHRRLGHFTFLDSVGIEPEENSGRQLQAGRRCTAFPLQHSGDPACS